MVRQTVFSYACYPCRQKEALVPVKTELHFLTEDNYAGLLKDPYYSRTFHVLKYGDGTLTFIPDRLFMQWNGLPAGPGDWNFDHCFIGRCSGFGIGSAIRVPENNNAVQHLRIGRYMSCGHRLSIIMGGGHPMNTISTSGLGHIPGMEWAAAEMYGDFVIHNDVWIGDNVLMLGGVTVENGCVIGAGSVVPPRKHLEPFGIYAGNPVRLVRFRFDERIIALLLDIEWWARSIEWVVAHKDLFYMDLNADIGRSMELLAEIKKAVPPPPK